MKRKPLGISTVLRGVLLALLLLMAELIVGSLTTCPVNLLVLIPALFAIRQKSPPVSLIFVLGLMLDAITVTPVGFHALVACALMVGLTILPEQFEPRISWRRINQIAVIVTLTLIGQSVLWEMLAKTQGIAVAASGIGIALMVYYGACLWQKNDVLLKWQ